MSFFDNQLIKVEDKILQEMVKSRWFELETPLIAAPISFRIKPSESSVSGLMLFTRGAIYIFNKKVFGAATLFKKFHLLNCQSFTLSQSSVELIFTEKQQTPEGTCNFEIKSNFSIQIAKIMLRVFNELTFGVSSEPFFEININPDIQSNILQEVIVKKRPNQALKMRAIFLCHYYNVFDDHLNSVNYFDIYDNNLKNYIIITQGFQPGNFAKACGHAIGWDSSITNIVFKGYKSSTFPELLNSILQNSIRFKEISFLEYQSNIQINFNFSELSCLKIKNWTLKQNCCQFVNDFISQMKSLIFPIDTLNIIDILFNSEHECTEFFEGISRNRSTILANTIYFGKIISRPFPFNSLQRFISLTQNLKTIAFSSIDVDGTKIFTLLCNQPMKNLERLIITRMQFRTIVDGSDEISQLHLPPNLLYMNVSGCFFTSSSLRFLLSFITKDPLEIPFIFEANEINVKSSFYNCLSKLNFEKINPNICEVSWNSNGIPSDSSRFFFAFLFTQKRLRMLSLKKIRAGNPTQLLQFVMQLITSIKLPAIDISFNSKISPVTPVDSEIFLQFIAALSQANFLRRIGLANAELGDEGLNVFKDVINNLTALTEITADGFVPQTKESFIGFWESVVKHPSIKAIDKPCIDYIYLRDQKIITNDDRIVLMPIFSEIRKMPKASNSIQREEYIKMMITENRLTNNPDVFLGTTQVDWQKNDKYQSSFQCDDTGLVQPTYQSDTSNYDYDRAQGKKNENDQ